MKLSVTTLGWPVAPLDTILKDIQQAGGFAGLDFRGLGEAMDITTLPAFNAELDQTMARVRAAGLTVSGLSTSVRLLNNDKGDRSAGEAVSYCRLADRMGVQFIRIFGGGPREGQSRAQWMAEAADNFKHDLDATSTCRAVICLETHDAWCHSADVAELLDKVNSPRAAALWDVCITALFGKETPATSAANLGRRIRYTHMKDGTGINEKGQMLLTLPGKGKVDMVGAVKELKKLDYDGWLTFEWEKRWHPDLPDAPVALPAYRNLLGPLA